MIYITGRQTEREREPRLKFELALSNLCRRPLTLEFTFYFSLDFSFLLQTIKKVRDFLSLPFYYYYHLFFLAQLSLHMNSSLRSCLCAHPQ